MAPHDSFLSGGNIEFIESLYARFLEDPQSVDESWRALFSGMEKSGQPIFADGGGAANGHAPPARAAPAAAIALSPWPSVGIEAATRSAAGDMGLQARVDQTVYAFRLRGHLLAQIDPLGRPRPPLAHVLDLGMVSEEHFSREELDQWVDTTEVYPGGQQRVPLKQLLGRLRNTYCHHIAVEYMQLLDSERRSWLRRRMEWCENRTDFTPAEQRRILTKLSYAEGFENFLKAKFVTAKRFSLDGGDSLVPMIDELLETGGNLGVRELVIGMAHRGRLNVLANVLGKAPDTIFSEFVGPTDPTQYLNRGDVKYHQGFSSDYVTQSGKSIHLTLAFNPSHLEVVYPVVEGRVRAKQDRLGGPDRFNCVPLVIHGDAAFSGQGLVAETLNLSNLPAYTTGGTVHIVINNQVGFTTDPEAGRSSHYATAMANMLDVPVFHVNGDDPEACVHVMRMAIEYRQRFNSDVVIDLLCFRRYGHNEGDDATFTQPKMYELIQKHPSVRTLYANALSTRGRVPAEEAERVKQQCQSEFQQAFDRAKEKSRFQEPSHNLGLWKGFRGGPDRETPPVDTGVPAAQLQALLRKLAEVPEGFSVHPILAKNLLPQRREMAEGKRPLDWSAGEALAFATLLTEGYALRLTGQDTERGTFTHRHAVLHDAKTGAMHTPLRHLSPKQGRCDIFNSPLSEMGCLGFEFGYSLDYPDALVAWEAQFGDFANNAQVIIDQFIAAAEDKWRRLSGLTLLLPHGYEGQGPEHSSARLERFLELCAEDNIQVCYPTTPAQMFHLLRRQVLRPLRKPLIVMTPKSPLRMPEVVSPLEALAEGRFQRLLTDRPDIKPAKVTRLLLCSGKVYWDLVKGRDAKKDDQIAIVRLEQLYPFPAEELKTVLFSMPKLEEVYWVQEEPRNAGAWRYMIQPLQSAFADLPKRPRYGYIGRVESASPATGFDQTHKYEQQLIVEEATTRGK